MSLVSASFIPNEPQLIPELSKNAPVELEDLLVQINKIKEKLEKLQPDTIIIIAFNPEIANDSFSIYQNPIYHYNFEKQRNLTLKSELKGNIGITHKIREALEAKAPLQMADKEELSHYFSVPLHILTENLEANIIPINCSKLDCFEHVKFGKTLKREIVLRKSKIAVIATGHIKNNNSLHDFLMKKEVRESSNFLRELNDEDQAKPLLILRGILDEISCSPTNYTKIELEDKNLIVSEFTI